VGKTALLEYLAGQAAGCPLLRVAGLQVSRRQPTRTVPGASELTLRRRQSLQGVHAVLVAEDTAPS
jgi:hypothetical protein